MAATDDGGRARAGLPYLLPSSCADRLLLVRAAKGGATMEGKKKGGKKEGAEEGQVKGKGAAASDEACLMRYGSGPVARRPGENAPRSSASGPAMRPHRAPSFMRHMW